MSQQLYFTNDTTGLTAVQPPTAMHLIEVGAHQSRDPRWGRQNPPVWVSPPPPPPPPPPPLPPPPEYVHEWTTSVHVSFRRRAPGAPGSTGSTGACAYDLQKPLPLQAEEDQVH